MILPKVSVIIPNYNHATYLPQRIESVLNQTFQDFEIILMDDCSTDNSPEIIKQYQHHSKVSRVLLNEVNSGSTFKQWNKGIREAKGEYIWLAESDDYADPDFLSAMLKPFEQYASIGLVFCSSYIIDKKDKIIDHTQNWLFPHEELLRTISEEFLIIPGIQVCSQYLTARCVIPNASAVIFKKKLYNEAGRADETLKMTGDWKLWFNILLLSDCGFISKPMNFFRSHANNVRTSKAHVVKEESLKNIKAFYKKLKAKRVSNPTILQYIFDWAFKDAIWKTRYKYSLQNMKLYLKDASFDMVYFLVRYKITGICKAHLVYLHKRWI